MIVLVPMVGKGTHLDPLRPEFVPQSQAEAEKAGVVSWAIQQTDDKRMAILQIVAKDRKVFEVIVADKRPTVKVFDLSKSAKATIETELKLVKKDFDLATFQVFAR